LARQVAAVELTLDALLQPPHHRPLRIRGGVAENPHTAAQAEILAVDDVASDDPLDLIAAVGAQPGGNATQRQSVVWLGVELRDRDEGRSRGIEPTREPRGRGRY